MGDNRPATPRRRRIVTSSNVYAVPDRATRREWAGLAVLALACLLVTMDLTVLFLAVPRLGADLDPGATELLWITDAYGFLMAGALVVMGALGDRLGRRRVLLAGAGGFAAASLLAAAAPSPEFLIVARGLQGLAGATLLPSTMALVFGMFRDEAQRTAALGAVMGCFALGAALGPLLGGALLELSSWRAVFVPNVPVMALLLVLAPRLVPEIRSATAGRIDVRSAVLSVVGILAAVYGIKDAARNGVEPMPAASIAAGVALLGAFVARQRRLAEPLIDIALFRRSDFSTALAANAVGMFVTYGTFFFTSQYLQLVAGLSPLEAGAWGLAPVAAMMITSGGVVPRLVPRVRPAYLVAGGMLVTATGLMALAGLDADASAAAVAVRLVVIVAGLAPTTTIGMQLIVGAAPPEEAGSVSGLGQAGNELGGALGIALLGSLGTAVYRSELSSTLDHVPAATANAAQDTLGGALGVASQLPPGAVDAATRAFTDGLGVTATVAAALLALAAVATAVLLRHLPATGPAMAPDVAAEPAPA
jgi:DHA2 family multidrug resistance protein-like MFS transporter